MNNEQSAICWGLLHSFVTQAICDSSVNMYTHIHVFILITYMHTNICMDVYNYWFLFAVALLRKRASTKTARGHICMRTHIYIHIYVHTRQHLSTTSNGDFLSHGQCTSKKESMWNSNLLAFLQYLLCTFCLI